MEGIPSGLTRSASKFVRFGANITKSFIYDVYYYIFSDLRSRTQTDTYQAYIAKKRYPAYLKNGDASSFIRDFALPFCKGSGLDVGCGKWPLPGSRGIDNSATENAYMISEESGSQDFIFSSHLLEHLERPKDALIEWFRVLKPNGLIFLYLPHPACDMWRPENLSFHKWSPTPEAVSNMLESAGFRVTDVSHTADIYFSFYVVARK